MQGSNLDETMGGGENLGEKEKVCGLWPIIMRNLLKKGEISWELHRSSTHRSLNLSVIYNYCKKKIKCIKDRGYVCGQMPVISVIQALKRQEANLGYHGQFQTILDARRHLVLVKFQI